MILPEINFAVKLPTQWNNRFYNVGNGGYASRIRHKDTEAGLIKRYAMEAQYIDFKVSIGVLCQ